MSKIFSAVKLLCKPQVLLGLLVERHGQWLPDKLYLKIIYRYHMGKRLNLRHPQTFGEKIQWLKLYNRKPEYTKMVDKLAVKEYVASIIGEQYIIPTLAVWNTPEEIEWEKLPSKFVLKTTHSGGSLGVVVCKDKSQFDRAKALKQLNIAMRDDIYRHYKEWPYKDVPKRIFAEKYMEDYGQKTDDLADFKWYCFDGDPKYCQVIQDRNTEETIDFYDTDWNHQDFVGLHPVAGPIARSASHPFPCPNDLEIQILLAKKLSKGIPYARIDLYNIEGKTYFGEITFFPASGLGCFSPKEYDLILGELIKLPGMAWGG